MGIGVFEIVILASLGLILVGIIVAVVIGVISKGSKK